MSAQEVLLRNTLSSSWSSPPVQPLLRLRVPEAVQPGGAGEGEGGVCSRQRGPAARPGHSGTDPTQELGGRRDRGIGRELVHGQVSPDGDTIPPCMQVHPSRGYLAVGEKGNQPVLAIYTLPELKLHRILRGQ